MKRIVVIGAGITGCYTAYFLIKKGCSVMVIDPAGIGCETTANNPGGLNPLHGPEIPGLMTELALRSYELHANLQDEVELASGINFHGHVVSRLEVALNEGEALAMNAAKDLYNSTTGFSARTLNEEEVIAAEPRLSSGISKGLLMEGNRMVESPSYARAVMTSAQKLGVEFQQVEATGLKKTDSRVTHVTTADGDIECDDVVFTTGAWFEKVSQWLETPIPIRPLKGQMLRAKLPEPRLPFHITRGLVGIYQVPDGTIWLGGTLEDVGFDKEKTDLGKDTILSGAAEIFPAIKDAEILEHLVGFRPASADKLPIIGSSSSFKNAYIASGGGPKGMLLSAGIAEAVTHSILKEEQGFSISQFLPSRFY